MEIYGLEECCTSKDQKFAIEKIRDKFLRVLYSGIRSFEHTLSILVSMAMEVLLPNKQHSSCISAPDAWQIDVYEHKV